MSAWRYRDDILSTLTNALLVLEDGTLRVCYANLAAERLLGCSSDTLARLTLLDLCAPARRERLARTLRALRTGQVLRLREFVSANGDADEGTHEGSPPSIEIIIHATLVQNKRHFVADLRPFDPDTRNQNRIEPQPRRQDVLLQGVANATNRLMQPGSYDRIVREALAILGEASDTDCVAIFQKTTPPESDDIVFVRQQHWMPLDERGARSPNFPARLAVQGGGLREFYARLERYEVVNGSAATLSELRQGLFRQLPAQSVMIAPIFIDVSLWGFIGLCDMQDERIWTGEEAGALQTMAASIGAAQQRQATEQRLRHEREVADTLREVGAVLTSTLDLDEMLARLLEQARRIVPFDSANVMLFRDGKAQIVHCTGHDAFGASLDEVRKVEFVLGKAEYVDFIAAHGTALILPDVLNSAAWKFNSGTHHVRCWLGMPILVRGEVVGLFALDAVTPGFYTDEHVKMLLPFAQQAGIAFENVRLYEQQRAQSIELAARLEQLDALYAASQSILSTLDLDEILQRFAEQMTRLTRSTGVVICDFDRETCSGAVQAIWPESLTRHPWVACARGDRLDFCSPLLDPVIAQHEIVRFTPEQAREAFAGRQTLEAAHELVIVPVFSEARMLGVALLCDEAASAFSPHDQRTCRTLATQATIAFEQALLFEDIRELERVKSEMIRLASHDLRGPLTRLDAYLEVISSRFDALSIDRRKNYLRHASETINEMQQIISDLLSLERIEEQHRLARPVVWSDVIGRALESIQADLEASECVIEVDCSSPLPDGRGDPIRLERALSNLIANAIKYSPKGGPITVRGRSKPYGEQQCIAIEVEDNGIGIPPEQQAQLFEPFYRVEATRKDFPGLGLGLSVVKAAVTYHNGSVYVDSEPGRGSLFGFRVPV